MTRSHEVGKPTTEQVREGLEWCRDWRDGQFEPAYHGDKWPVEMHGLVGDYEVLALAYLGEILKNDHARFELDGAENELALARARIAELDAALRDELDNWNPERRPTLSAESRIRANRLLLEQLADLWDAVPDQRFGQLVMNLTRDADGFADSWEWKHGDWRKRIEEAWTSWAAGVPS